MARVKIYASGYQTVAVAKRLADVSQVPTVFEVDNDTLTRADVVDLVQANIPFDGLVAFTEINIGTLNNNVPATFPNSTISDPDPRQKKWKEYALYKVNNAGTKALVTVGWRDENGNRPYPIDSSEFLLWVKLRGAANILLKSEAVALIASDYTPTE